MAKMENIDWDKAYKAHKESLRTGDANEFITICLPVAENYARNKANLYRNNAKRPLIDQDAFLSAALGALLSVSATKLRDEEDNPTKLEHFCINAMNNRMLDVVRKELRRQSNSGHRDISIDDFKDRYQRDEILLRHSARKTPSSSPLEEQDRKQEIELRLEPILSKGEHEVICAMLYKDNNKTQTEMAEEIGISPVTFRGRIRTARQKIQLECPDLEREIMADISRSPVRAI